MKQALQALIDEMEYVLSCINEDKIPFDGDDFHEALRLGKEALAKQKQGESCTNKERTEYLCKNRHQCWEPCGELGKSEEHTQVYQQEQGDPVGTAGELFTNSALERLDFRPSTKIYTTPQQRTWVGLTDDEIKEIHRLSFGKDIAVATGLTEAKLKEKND
jgi:hypothetical protein